LVNKKIKLIIFAISNKGQYYGKLSATVILSTKVNDHFYNNDIELVPLDEYHNG
jgi:hypothetical protein